MRSMLYALTAPGHPQDESVILIKPLTAPEELLLPESAALVAAAFLVEVAFLVVVAASLLFSAAGAACVVVSAAWVVEDVETS